MKQNHKFVIGLFLFLSFAGACTDEQEGISLGKEEAQGITVNLALSSLPLQGSGTVTRSAGTGMDLVLGDDADASTRIVDDGKESDVNDICIFQFEGDSKGSSSAVLIKSATPVTTLPLVLAPFTKCFLYVCANVGDITGEYNVGEAASNYTVGASTFQDMLDGSFKVNAQSDFGEALPMSGCSDIIKTNAVPNKIGITLTRMVAKVTFTCHLDKLPSGDIFKITGAKLCNVPQKAMYEQPLDNTSTVEVTSHVGTVSMDATGKIATCVWYMPENKRGIKDGINSWAERVEKNAPKYSSFIELSGNYTRSGATTATEVAYSIYLGNGTMSNYDVERNYRYQFTSTIKGVNTADRRVTTDTNLSADGLANCYLAGEDNHWYRFNGTVRGNGNTVDYAALQYPGQGVSLFPSPVTGAPDAVTIPIGQVANAVVVWETAAGLISDLNWDSSSGYVRFKTGTAKGNALIAVRNAGGDILWSWHIWRTNGVDLATLNTKYALNIQTNTDCSWYKDLGADAAAAARKRNLTILDRNIGAAFDGTLDIEDCKGANCLQYEFGRKDPFPAGTTYSSTQAWPTNPGDVTLYGYATGNKVAFTIYQKEENATSTGNTSTATKALDYVIKHPEVFFRKDDTSYNWIANATVDSKDWMISNCLWGDNNWLEVTDQNEQHYIYVDPDPWDGEKTIYDPSPAGWRVTPADAFTGIVANNAKWGYPSINDIYRDGSWATGWWVYFNGDKTVRTFLPASGIRNNDQGKLAYAGMRNANWFSSPAGLNSVMGVYITLGDASTAAYAVSSHHRIRGFSVRCARYNAGK